MSIQSIIRWFETAKPEPTSQDLIKQCVFHIEEFIEMLDALGVNYIQDDLDLFQNSLMIVADDPELSDKFVQSIDRIALLDACADQVVTATGVATFAGMDFEPALEEVDNSNWTKFALDEKGNPVPYIRPDGKIGKNPKTYQEPQLEPFLTRNKGD